MPNQKIADAAIAAMHDPEIEARHGFCSRFARQVVSKVYGSRYQGLFGASAIDTGHNFQNAGLDVGVPESSHLQVGDLLFKMHGSGSFGHVGIYVGERGVASNSSTMIGRISGAKGFRTLGQWGPWELVGRIPGESPAAADGSIMYHLMLNGSKIADMPVQDGIPLCPVRSWAAALGFEVGWNESVHHVLLDGNEIAVSAVMIADHAYLPIATLVESAGLHILEQDPDTHLITVGH